MTAIIIDFKNYHAVHHATKLQMENYIWFVNWEYNSLKQDVLELNSHQIEERLDLEEKMYDLIRDPFYIAICYEATKRGMEDELCLRVN